MLNTPEEKLCLEYLKDQMLNGPLPDGETQRPTIEAWNEMPEKYKIHLVKMVIGFKNGNTLIDKIIKDYHKKYDDRSFGMRIKGYIKELLSQ